ncbi:MAG: KGK domain-containing protein [Elainella sp.]
MDNDYGLLRDDEVLFVQSGRIVMANPTFKVSEFLDALAQLISEQEAEWSDEREGWFNDRGQSCEVLRFENQGWQRGRVRIRLEFCPERPPKLLREADSYRGEETAREIPYLPRRQQDPYGSGDYRQTDPLDDFPDDDY